MGNDLSRIKLKKRSEFLTGLKISKFCSDDAKENENKEIRTTFAKAQIDSFKNKDHCKSMKLTGNFLIPKEIVSRTGDSSFHFEKELERSDDEILVSYTGNPDNQHKTKILVSILRDKGLRKGVESGIILSPRLGKSAVDDFRRSGYIYVLMEC